MSQEVLASLLKSARYEILPTAGVVDRVHEYVVPGRVITVTASTGLTLEATLSTAEQLQALGFTAVPHIAARMVQGRTELEEIVDRLTQAGIDRIFVPAGDATPPAGGYAGALDLIIDLASMAAPIQHLGVGAYPETHPLIPDDVTVQAMWDKRDYATHLVSNLCFDPGTIATWLARVRARGIDLPLILGIAGKVELAKLARVATKIGVGESTRFLAQEHRQIHQDGQTRRLQPPEVPRQARSRPGQPEHGRGRVAYLHVQSDQRHGDLAAQAACGSWTQRRGPKHLLRR